MRSSRALREVDAPGHVRLPGSALAIRLASVTSRVEKATSTWVRTVRAGATRRETPAPARWVTLNAHGISAPWALARIPLVRTAPVERSLAGSALLRLDAGKHWQRLLAQKSRRRSVRPEWRDEALDAPNRREELLRQVGRWRHRMTRQIVAEPAPNARAHQPQRQRGCAVDIPIPPRRDFGRGLDLVLAHRATRSARRPTNPRRKLPSSPTAPPARTSPRSTCWSRPSGGCTTTVRPTRTDSWPTPLHESPLPRHPLPPPPSTASLESAVRHRQYVGAARPHFGLDRGCHRHRIAGRLLVASRKTVPDLDQTSEHCAVQIREPIRFTDRQSRWDGLRQLSARRLSTGSPDSESHVDDGPEIHSISPIGRGPKIAAAPGDSWTISPSFVMQAPAMPQDTIEKRQRHCRGYDYCRPGGRCKGGPVTTPALRHFRRGDP